MRSPGAWISISLCHALSRFSLRTCFKRAASAIDA